MVSALPSSYQDRQRKSCKVLMGICAILPFLSWQNISISPRVLAFDLLNFGLL